MSIEKIKTFSIQKSDQIDGVVIFKPTLYIDHRGSLFTTFHSEIFSEFLPPNYSFEHDKFSVSKHRVLRGIHGDNETWKLVTAVYGAIYQVVVDCRPHSITYGKWQSFEINGNNLILILLPPGIGNAFYVLSKEAVYHYKLAYLGEYNDFDKQFTVKWNDPFYNIQWPTDSPILSSRDQS